MADPFYTCCEDGMLSQVPPTDRSGLCPACRPDEGVPKQDSETLAQAVAGHIDGWRSATFGWQGDADPIKDADNRQRAIQAHAAECLRRIRATLGVGGTPK